MLLAEVPVTDVHEEAWTNALGCTLLHLALGGGGALLQEGPPLSASQSEVAAFLLEAMGNPAECPVPEWAALDQPSWVPPVAVPDKTSGRLPLHLAALLGAAPSLVEALLQAYPSACRQRDRAPKQVELRQPGYLPAHYALGAARKGTYAFCTPADAQVQALLLDAYPLSEWPLVDLVRAGPHGASVLLERLADDAFVATLAEEDFCAWWSHDGVVPYRSRFVRSSVDGGGVEYVRGDEEKEMYYEGAHERGELLVHLAVAHAAPPEVITAMLQRHSGMLRHLWEYSAGVVGLLPLHLAPTAALVDALCDAEPTGVRKALTMTSSRRQPYCAPFEYMMRNGAPVEVVESVAKKDAVCDTLRAQARMDAVCNQLRALGPTHRNLWKVEGNARDMREPWKGRDARASGLRRLLGGDRHAEEGATPLLCAIIEGREEEVRVLLVSAREEDVNTGARPWGCDCSNAGGCTRCVGRELAGGWTPLHEACFLGNAPLVRKLLDARADVTLKTRKYRLGGGTNALEVALDQDQDACAELLRGAGAVERLSPDDDGDE